MGNKLIYLLLSLLVTGCVPQSTGFKSANQAGTQQLFVPGHRHWDRQKYVFVPDHYITVFAYPGQDPRTSPMDGRLFHDLPMSPEEVARYTKLLDLGLQQDSALWGGKKYDVGSVQDLQLDSLYGDFVNLYARFTYNNGQYSELTARLYRGTVSDFCPQAINSGSCHRPATAEDIANEKAGEELGRQIFNSMLNAKPPTRSACMQSCESTYNSCKSDNQTYGFIADHSDGTLFGLSAGSVKNCGAEANSCVADCPAR